MTQTSTKTNEEQRGKRKTALRTEIILAVLIIASLGGVPNAFELLKLVLIPGLGYAAALRGLDGMFAARSG